MHIVYISDGKAGHRSQALGLFKALQRQSDNEVTFQEISIEDLPILPLIGAAFKKQHSLIDRAPALIIGVGSHTQLRVMLLGKAYPQAKTAIMMKPNYPFSWFDYALIPEHDGAAASDHVLLTQGALNPIVNEHRHQAGRILIALGGSSKRHEWNETKVLSAVQNIVERNPQSEIILTTSRRTPAEFVSKLCDQAFALKLQIFPVEETPQGWIFEEMQKAEAVWVTEDSVSMIYEALTAGCRVGVIYVDRLKADRIVKSVDALLQKNIISDAQSVQQLQPASQFAEADRAAGQMIISIQDE